MGAVPGTTGGFIDDFPLPQFEACNGTTGINKKETLLQCFDLICFQTKGVFNMLHQIIVQD